MKDWILKLADKVAAPKRKHNLDVALLSEQVKNYINKLPGGVLDNEEVAMHYFGGILEQMREMGDIDFKDKELDALSLDVAREITSSKKQASLAQAATPSISRILSPLIGQVNAWHAKGLSTEEIMGKISEETQHISSSLVKQFIEQQVGGN